MAVVATLCIGAAAPAGANPSIVVDLQSNTVLAASEPDRRWQPASLTKLMTALVAFRMIERGVATLETPVRISKRALSAPPSKMGFPAGTTITLRAALQILVIKSANDIAIAVAESLAGSVEAYVAHMNEEAFRLALANTMFANPNGLEIEGQFTSARDIAIVAATIRRDFPQYAEWFAHDGLIVGKRTIAGFNGLLGRFDGADGMKTGFICASGYNQVASATRNGRTIIAVDFGEASAKARTEALAALLAQGFANPPIGPKLGPGPAQPASPPDMRDMACPKPVKPVAKTAAKAAPSSDEPSEAGNGNEPTSPFLTQKAARVINPLKLDLGTPDGPVPPEAEVFMALGGIPIPIPRPTHMPDPGVIVSDGPAGPGETILRGSFPVPSPRPQLN